MALFFNGTQRPNSGLIAKNTPKGYTAHTEYGCTSRSITPRTFMRNFDKSTMEIFKKREVKMLSAQAVDLRWIDRGKDITQRVFNGHQSKYKDFYILVSKEKQKD